MRDVDATVAQLASRPRHTAVLVDFDGSLAPIVDHPEAARPLPSALAVLGRLVSVMGRVAVVSGRPVDFLAEHLPVRGLMLVGQYGIESLVDGIRRVDPRTEAYLAAVESAAVTAERRLPGIYVERKGGLSVTLHWRTASERAEQVVGIATELASEFGLDAPQRGRKAIELRPPVPVDKGSATDDLIDGFAVAAFAGDDTGDLPAFDALERAAADGRLEQSVRIGVLSPEAPAELRGAVDAFVDGPAGLVELLTAIANRASA